MILQDTLGDALLLSVFDFVMGFVVLYLIGLVIKSLKYVHVIDRGKGEPAVKVKTTREA
ncbi:MAG: hypothetical protein HY675_01585 [Chloroflexi bacterium]|nr:hypothetical protein [Chloroflexota bacterium]